MSGRTHTLSRDYRLLAPGPVVRVATTRNRRADVIAPSSHTMMGFEPPHEGCVLGNRNYSFAALKATRGCTIAIPTAQRAKQVVAYGNASGRRVDKFAVLPARPGLACISTAPVELTRVRSLDRLFLCTRSFLSADC